MVYEPEPRGRHLLVGVEFKPQIIGSAGEGQTLHRRACVGAKEWGGTILAIIHLSMDREMGHDVEFSRLTEDALPTIRYNDNIKN